ncbi:uncharacterized protein ISCGN_003666 [Ixodes scapularis]
MLNVYSPPRYVVQDFRSLFREASTIVGGNALVLVGDFNARHTSWGYQEDSKKGKQLAAAIDNERLEIINDLLRPTRTGNSINRDTNPDLTKIKNLDQHKVTWKNTEETIGSDHAIIEISVEASTNRRKIGASKMTNWNKFRHLGPEGGIEDLETWVAELQATKAHCTKEISLTEAIPGVDTHLLGLWEKRKGIVKRWKKQKHNRKLRLRISVLNKQTEEYATQLAQQNWDQKCDSLQGTLGLAQTWRLLHHLVSPAQTKSEGCKTTLKIVHSYKGTDEDLLKQIKKKYIGSLGEKEERLQRAADTVHVYVKSRGLRCSPEKSEIIRIHRNGYDRGVPINVSLDGQDIPEVKQLRILGMWIQHNGKATRAIQLLQKTTEQVTKMITRITNRRRGLKEKDVMKLIQALVISRVVYSLPYHYLDMKEQEQVEVLIRKTYKIALGLPQNAPTAKLELMGVHNTFQEHKEALLMAQRSRLKKSGTGRQLMQKLGYGDCTEVIQNSRELGAGVKGTYIVRPIPKHMNLIMHRGKRRARAQYYEREGKDNETFVYVDAGDYRRDAKVAVALDHAYDEISSCSIKNASMEGAEEHAIALAMIHGYRTKKSYTILTDSQNACRNYLWGFINKTSAAALERAWKEGVIHKIIWIPGHEGLTGNLIADAVARAYTNRAAEEASGPTEPVPQTYSSVLNYYKAGRMSLPPPHPKLSRNKAVRWRQLQAGTFPSLLRFHHISPESYSDRCPWCQARATLYRST